MGREATLSRATAIIPAYGGWSYLASLLSDLEPASDWLQVVVIDDASPSDGAREIGRRFPWIELVRRQVNGGFAAAVNDGLVRAEGEIIAVLNSDMRVEASALERLVSQAQRRTNCFVGPRTVTPTGQVLATARTFHDVGQLLAEYTVPLRLLPRLDARLRDWDVAAMSSTVPVAVDWLVGSCLVFHRSVYERVGGLDTRYYMNSEDLEWQYQARQHGIGATYVPEVTVEHDPGHGGAEAGTLGDHRFLWVWEGHFRFVRDYLGLGAHVRLRLGMAALYLAMIPFWASVWLISPARRDQVRDQVRRHGEALRLTIPRARTKVYPNEPADQS